MKFAVALWKETMDEGGLAWDDTSNNRAFLSGSISATNNGASIYLEAKKKPDSYLTEKGTPMKDDILHASIPGGAGGQFNLPGPNSPPGDEVLEEPGRGQEVPPLGIVEGNLREVVHLAAGLYLRPDQDVGGPSGVERRPGPRPVQEAPGHRAPDGYAGKPNQKAAEVQTKYIIVDMYAKAIQGMDAAESVKAAHAELVKIYGA